MKLTIQLIAVLALMALVCGCGSDTRSAGQLNSSANQTQQTLANNPPQIQGDINKTSGSACGDGVCISSELASCSADCPNCDDKDNCTADSFDLTSLKCMNIGIKNCCGDGICGTEEQCSADCPPKRLTLASYPYPFVHGNELTAEIIVGDEGTSKEVSAATAIATSFDSVGTVYGTLASEVSSIKNRNTILIGNPCTNKFIKELMPFANDCLEDYEKGEGRISIFLTGKSGDEYTYSLVVSGYSGDDVRRAADVLANYEFNMEKLKGYSSKV